MRPRVVAEHNLGDHPSRVLTTKEKMKEAVGFLAGSNELFKQFYLPLTAFDYTRALENGRVLIVVFQLQF